MYCEYCYKMYCVKNYTNELCKKTLKNKHYEPFGDGSLNLFLSGHIWAIFSHKTTIRIKEQGSY